MKFQTIYQFISYNRSRSQKGKRTSTSDDLAPDFANDAKSPSICPAVNAYSLVSLKCACVCLCDAVDQSYSGNHFIISQYEIVIVFLL